jgi:hypothetical protein
VSRIVGLNGEPITPQRDLAAEHIARLEAERGGLVNMMAVFVKRAGGLATITEAELLEIDAYTFTAQNGEDGKSVALSITKVEPEPAT